MKTLLISTIGLLLIINCQSQTWTWAEGSNNNAATGASHLATNNNGDVIITGSFTGSLVAFGSQTLNAVSGNNLYVVKYDNAGNVLWAKTQSGGNARGRAVVTDISGNIYIAGMFSSTISMGSQTLSSVGSNDIFLAKYDAAGNVIWAKSGGSTASDQVNATCIDESGNVYLTGSFSGSVAAFSTLTLSSSGSSESLLLKYDPNGNILWGLSSNCPGGDQGTGVTCDSLNNIYIGGFFGNNAVNFGTVTINPSGANSSYYLLKCDSTGNAIWGLTPSGAGYIYSSGVAAEPNGNVYLAGSFTGTLIIGQSTFTVSSNPNAFLVKYDASGNPLWTKITGGTGAERYYTLSLFPGGIFAAGSTNGSHFTIDSILVGALPGNDGTMFINEYDTAGAYKKSAILKGTGADEALIAALDQCTVYATGDYQVPSFAVGTTTLVKTASGHPAYTAKLVFSPPVFISGGNFKLCSGQSITLSGNGAFTYTWNTGALSSSIIVSPTVNTSYTLYSTGGCGNSQVVKTITVNPLPLISAVTDQDTICSDDVVTLTASGANTYTWTGGVSNGVPFSPNVPATYYVTGSSQAGCLSSNTASVYVHVIASPLIPPTASSTLICSGETTTLFATGATSYSWEPGGLVQGTVVVSPTLSTVYTVTKTNGMCVITDFVYIDVMPSPELFTTISASTICMGDSVVLAASGADLYYWNTSDSGNVIVVTPMITTGYTVTGTSLINSCSSGHMFEVEVIDCSVGIAEGTGSKNIRIFPNPARSRLTIELPDKYLDCELFLHDASGKKILEMQCHKSSLELDLTQIPPGLYFLRLINEKIPPSGYKLLIE